MTPFIMCDTCVKKHLCQTAYTKEEWCGNYVDKKKEQLIKLIIKKDKQNNGKE